MSTIKMNPQALRLTCLPDDTAVTGTVSTEIGRVLKANDIKKIDLGWGVIRITDISITPRGYAVEGVRV